VELLLLLLPMIALILLRVPVAYSIGMSAVAFALMQGSNPVAVVQRSVASLDSFTLLAIPLFILAAEVMNAAGLTRTLMDSVLGWVGHLPGGLAHANVGASLIFGGISGSAVADAAGLGRLLIPQMVRGGYSPAYSASITASSALISPILPPSIPFVVYGLLAQVSVGALFFAGIVPAVLMAVALGIVVVLTTFRQRELPRGEFSLRTALTRSLKALPVLLLPVLIIGGLRFGFFTPTEAAAVAVFYSLLCSLLYVRIGLRKLRILLVRTALTSASILIIIAFAGHLGWLMSVKGIPAALAELLAGITTNPQLLLLIVVAFLLIIGTFMEALAAMLIVVPVLGPAVTQLGIDPIQFGVVVVLTLMLGLLTPPVGLVLYVVGETAGLDAIQVAKANVPFFLALLGVLMLVVFVPAVSLWLPTILFG